MHRIGLQWANGSMEVPVVFSRLGRLKCILSSEEFFVFHTDGSNKLLHSLAYRERAYLHYVKDSYVAKVESFEPTSFLRTTQEPDYILEGTTDLNFVEGDEFRLLKQGNHQNSFDGFEPDSS
jgi:hypothetical protein